MTQILVTGGTGVLGRQVVKALQARGITPRVLSRQQASSSPTVVFFKGDLTTGTGLKEALEGVDVVVHCAHNPEQPQKHLLGTQNLLAAMQKANVKHVVLISILGIDRLSLYPYYRAKLQEEKLFQASGIPCTILRAAQFHDFLGFLIEMLVRLPVVLLPRDLRFQPVQVEAVAQELAQLALQPPAGQVKDLAGPEVLALDSLVQSWLLKKGMNKRIYTFPLPLPFMQTFRDLAATEVNRKGETWDQWLSGQQTSNNAYQKARG